VKYECHVIDSADGWVIEPALNGRGRVYENQRDAVLAAREALRNSGGGELIIHGRDGRIRDKDTVFSKRSNE
jgi:Uncharacterized protein conserved in bacteria (DUF2188)